jgi:hypothetical protein
MTTNDQEKKEMLQGIFARNYEKAIAKWLKQNPHIGQLNGNKFYNTTTLEPIECPIKKETLNHTWGRA